MCFFVFWCSLLSAREYATTELKEIAGLLEKKSVPHKEIIDSMSGKVVHLGFDLFENSEDPYSQTFQRFIERYALRMYLLPSKEATNIMCNNKVSMDVEKISKLPKANFFMVSVDSSRFIASWFMNKVSFPKDFALVYGLNKKESDSLFVNKIRQYKLNAKEDSIMSNIVVSQVDSLSYLAKMGDHYFINEMNADQFYVKVSADSLLPIYNENYLKETTSNILQTLIKGDFTLEIEQNMYGYKKSKYNIPLFDFSKICKEDGCVPYVGVESQTESEINLVVLYKNEYFSYNHLLFVTFKTDDIKTQKGILKSLLYVYIPTTNLKSLIKEKNIDL